MQYYQPQADADADGDDVAANEEMTERTEGQASQQQPDTDDPDVDGPGEGQASQPQPDAGDADVDGPPQGQADQPLPPAPLPIEDALFPWGDMAAVMTHIALHTVPRGEIGMHLDLKPRQSRSEAGVTYFTVRAKQRQNWLGLLKKRVPGGKKAIKAAGRKLVCLMLLMS